MNDVADAIEKRAPRPGDVAADGMQEIDETER